MIRSLLLRWRGTSSSSKLATVNRVQGFNPSAANRCQCRGYIRSTKHSQEKANGNRILHQNQKASDSSGSSILAPTFSFVIPAALLGFVGLAAFVHYNDERRVIPKGQETNRSAAIAFGGPRIGGPFTLINSDGQIVDQSSLLGKWILLYFGYTSSPDVGPAEVQKMVKAAGILESTESVKVQPVFVTLDPQRDNPSQLKAYLKEFDSRMVGLTGPVTSIKEMAQSYRVYFKKVEEDGNDYLVETSHNMYLMSPTMEILKCFGTEYNEDQLAEGILAEIRSSTV